MVHPARNALCVNSDNPFYMIPLTVELIGPPRGIRAVLDDANLDDASLPLMFFSDSLLALPAVT